MVVRLTVSGRSSLLNPVCEVADKVKEEVALRNTDDLVGDLDKQTKALAGPKVEPLGDVLAEIFGSS